MRKKWNTAFLTSSSLAASVPKKPKKLFLGGIGIFFDDLPQQVEGCAVGVRFHFPLRVSLRHHVATSCSCSRSSTPLVFEHVAGGPAPSPLDFHNASGVSLAISNHLQLHPNYFGIGSHCACVARLDISFRFVAFRCYGLLVRIHHKEDHCNAQVDHYTGGNSGDTHCRLPRLESRGDHGDGSLRSIDTNRKLFTH